jgi:hypothetical protein
MSRTIITDKDVAEENAELEALREVAKAAREFYSAASICMEPGESTEGDHYRFQISKHELHEALKKVP